MTEYILKMVYYLKFGFKRESVLLCGADRNVHQVDEIMKTENIFIDKWQSIALQ